MNVYITGICGNIGSHAALELIAQGHHVSGLDVPSPHNKQIAKKFNGKVKLTWGDIRNAEDIQQGIVGQDVIIHLAYILPPASEDNPKLTEDVNMNGTRTILACAVAQSPQPKFIFASSLDLFGYTQDQPPPRKVSDPVYATDDYTRHKLAGEKMVQESGLTWAIMRFADVPPLAARSPHPIMFRIPLATRFEMLHPQDAGLALANGVQTAALWHAIWLIGGGATCQVRYRDYLNSMLTAMGIGALPEAAFGHDPYCTDWLDTTASEALLHYQHHTYQEIIRDISHALGASRFVIPLLRPIIRRNILKLSPYLKQKPSAALTPA